MISVNVIVYFLIIHMSTSLTIKDITGNETQLWLSKEKFKTIVDATLTERRCCNIFYYDMNIVLKKLFYEFMYIYSASYSINQTKYNCHDYLILGTNENNVLYSLSRVPTKNAVVKILVIVDTNLDPDSQLFNVSYYRNSEVNLVSISGIWKLSANYLEKRTFKKIKKLQEMNRKILTPNLKGRELQLIAFNSPPYTYLNKTVIKVIKGKNVEVFDTDSEEENDGIEVKIIALIAEKLNFTWTIRTPPGTAKYGVYNGSKWNGGVIEPLLNDDVDLAFTCIWLTEDRYKVINLTEAWHEVSVHFSVPRPKPYTSFWALTKPFSRLVWITFVTMILTYSTYVYCRSWINPTMPKRFRHFLITLTELIGRLTGIWCPRNTGSLRFQLQLWQMAGLMFVAAYNSSLAARLTNSDYEARIDTIKQLIDANLTWGYHSVEPTLPMLFDLKDPYEAQLPSRCLEETSYEERHERINEGKYAILGGVIESFFFPADYVSPDDLDDFRVMQNPIGKFYLTFGVQSWLLEHINRVIRRLKESGILARIIRDVLRRKAGNHFREVTKEYDVWTKCPLVLSLTPLGASFVLLLSGMIVSSIVFYLEIREANNFRSH